jgi:ABC-type branched-subunit amino acid transport system ATPase component
MADLGLSGVSLSFGGLEVLRDVSFAAHPGELLALIGPNGAGKTTLFNVINGLVRPSGGSLRLGARELVGLPAFRISRLGVGRTFQTPRPFLDLTALDNVRAAARFSERAAEAPEALLVLVGLAAQAAVPARALTAVGRKLLELAMALALGPRFLLLDELLAGLTPTEVTGATALFQRIRDERGIGIFWVEHVMHAVMTTADRCIVLHHGEVIGEGAPAAVARDRRVMEAYLGEPTAAPV